MAKDCYKDSFLPAYRQAVIDGLATSVAAEVGRSAMDDCLRQQAVNTPAATPLVQVPGSIAPDPGPTSGGDMSSASRGSILGNRRNDPKKGKS